MAAHLPAPLLPIAWPKPVSKRKLMLQGSLPEARSSAPERDDPARFSFDFHWSIK
jgi:hypothetical protein